MEDLYHSIETVCENIGIDINLRKNMMLCQSHGKIKRSYHVIINEWCHPNNVEAKIFYNEVMCFTFCFDMIFVLSDAGC